MSPTPEQRARQDIDAALEATGWIIQDRAAVNLSAGPGVAVREFRMASGHGFVDYLLFVNGKAVGALEAKPAGYALTNVELQADKYAGGLPAGLNPPVHPLPFIYLSTGVETRFINGLDPDPKTRAISANLPHIHRPATLAEWIESETLDAWVKRVHAHMAEGIMLSDLSASQLLRLHAELSAELRRRGICRSSNNPVADYAEGIVAKALHLQLASGSTTGFDAVDSEGRRYEIKARRETSSAAATMLSAIRGLEKRHFDFLVVVLFNEDYSVRKAIRLRHEIVRRIARFRKHVNGHIVMIRDLWTAEGSEDLTMKLAEEGV